MFSSCGLDYRQILKGLGEWILVRAGAIDRWHGNLQHAQIHRELPAMVIEMIHEDGANESYSRDGHQRFSISRQAPRGRQSGFVHVLERFLGARKILGESVQNFLAAVGLRLRKFGTSI